MSFSARPSVDRARSRWVTPAAIVAMTGATACFAGVDAVYVSTTGDNNNSGVSPDAPLRTLAEALTTAELLGLPIFIAGGTYNETVELIDGIDLFGGYDEASGWTRDPVANVTTIRGGDGGGGGGGPSIGIVNNSMSAILSLANAFNVGAGGTGGTSPAGGTGEAGFVDDIVGESGFDCNGNRVIDEMDIASGFSNDCNANTIPDECDIPTTSLADCDQNGVSDVCEGFGPLDGSFFEFDGDDSIQVDDAASLRFVTDFSIEAWIYPTGAGSHATAGGNIVNKEGEYAFTRFPNGTIRWAVAFDDPAWTWTDTEYVAPLNAWTHVAFTHTAGELRFYANGELEHIAPTVGLIGDTDAGLNQLWIGGRQGSNQFFDGRIDDVRAWNRARAPSEIQEDLATTLVGNETGLVGYWSFDTILVGSTPDLAQGNDGLISGAILVAAAAPPCEDATDCPCEIDGETDQVDVLDLLAFLSGWFTLDIVTDINDDGVVDVLDLLDFLSCWFPTSNGADCP